MDGEPDVKNGSKEAYSEDWYRILDQLRDLKQQAIQNLLDHQAREKQILLDKINFSEPPSVKHSPTYLELKVKLNGLVAAKRYKEAHKAQQELAVLEKKEKSDWIEKYRDSQMQKLWLLEKEHEKQKALAEQGHQKHIPQDLKQKISELTNVLNNKI